MNDIDKIMKGLSVVEYNNIPDDSIFLVVIVLNVIKTDEEAMITACVQFSVSQELLEIRPSLSDPPQIIVPVSILRVRTVLPLSVEVRHVLFRKHVQLVYSSVLVVEDALVVCGSTNVGE